MAFDTVLREERAHVGIFRREDMRTRETKGPKPYQAGSEKEGDFHIVKYNEETAKTDFFCMQNRRASLPYALKSTMVT